MHGATIKVKSQQFSWHFIVRCKSFTERFCGAEEGKAGELRDTDND
jgi:hypothetical protein